MLFSGDVFGCHFCDARLFNDRVGDFRFSFEYYYAHIMRPFREYVREALDLIEPLELKLIAPAHGPILRDAPRAYVQRYRQLAAPQLHNEADRDKTLIVFYISLATATPRAWRRRCATAPRKSTACAPRCTTCRAARSRPSST